ncbi:unnamed protein product [Arabis nemorensis]|uniref:Pectinesterase catalytic domain-containing protein n=1 Tax=Arabis nemorensis TaxID=586526 RepID=A0A565AU65_9BRAS|nr:unnamed protein product [Arabis nemorensis]
MNRPDPIESSNLTDNHQPVIEIANGHIGTNNEPFLEDTGPLTTTDGLTVTKENGDVTSNSEMMVEDSGVSSFRQTILLNLNTPAADNEHNETHYKSREIDTTAMATALRREAIKIHSTLTHQHQQFYRDCYITGTVDFICGDTSAVFQNCHIKARKPIHEQRNMIKTQKREVQSDKKGFSFQKCTIIIASHLAPIKRTIKTYLGHLWGVYSHIVFMECFIADLIDPEGRIPWKSDTRRLSTVYYGEYENKGSGADTSRRVKCKSFNLITNMKEAANFTVGKQIYPDSWLKTTRVSYDEGL